MGKVCNVPNCCSGSSADKRQRREQGIRQASLFKIPKSPNKQKRWGNILGCKLRDSMYICELHFLNKDIQKTDTILLKCGIEHSIPRIRWALNPNASPILAEDNRRHAGDNNENNTNGNNGASAINNKENEIPTESFENRKVSSPLSDRELSAVEESVEMPVIDENGVCGAPLLINSEPVQNSGLEVQPQISRAFTLETMITQLREMALPEAWSWMKKPASLMFTFHNRSTFEARIHLRIGENLSTTICTSTGQQIPIDPVASMADMRASFRAVEKLQVCSGTGMDGESRAENCIGILDANDEYKRARPILRCENCRYLRQKLQKRKNHSDSMAEIVSTRSRRKLASARKKCMRLKLKDLRSTSRPIFYVGDINTAQPALVDPVASSFYRSSKRGELSDGCSNEDGCMGGSDLEGEGKQVLVGICAMAKKSQSKPMKEILTRLEEFEYIKILVFPEDVILKEPVEDWPIVDCLISFHSKGFPLDKAIHYANLRNPFTINNLPMQYDIQDRRRVYAILDGEGIEIPRYAVLDRDSADPKHHELVESEDHVEVNGVTFNKPFVEKPVSAEDHNIYIYYPTSAGGGSQRLFRKIGSRSSVYSPESRVRKTGSYIYEDFMPTDGTDVKVYTVGPDYAHAEARKSPALDGKVERDSEGKEIRYPVILSNAEKLISRKVCLAFKQTVCGFDLLRANGKSFVCDVNGFSFVKNSNKYYDDCAKILGNMILRELAPTLHIPWSVPFQLDDPPIVPTTFGKMMELRCVVAVIRHGDRTPKQKMKVEVRHPKFFEIFAKYDGYKHGHVKLKRPKQLQEILDTARSLLTEIQHRAAGPELEEKQGKLEQLKSVLEMYGHFSGINRKVQMKYQPRGRPRGSSSDDGNSHNRLGEPSLVLILKWGGELTPAGRIQAEELGRIFRCMYPGGQGRHLSEEDSEMLPSHGEYAGAQGLGLLRLHSTFRHDLKIYASDEGRVQMTAAAFAKGLLALEGELTPILVQMVKSANTNGLLDNDCDSSKYQNMVKTRLHELLQQDREFTREDREQINPGNALSINDALDFVKNPVKCCQHVQALIQKLMDIVRIKKDDPKTKDAILYHGETWELMGRRWGKIEKDFCTKNKRFDISKIPDIYDCIKYDLQHNNHTLQFDHAEELYIYAKYLADIVIPQEYGLTVQEKLTIGQGICTPLLKKIRADLQRNIEESGEETVNRLNPRYSHGVSSPGRHVRTRLYFTSESHVHSLLTVLRYGGLLDVVKDEQWRRAMEYVSMVSELNYMSQIVVMLYEDPTKDPSSEERFHVELHFSPGVNCCVQKNLPPGPGFRPHSRNESSHNLETNSQCNARIDEEDAELGSFDDGATSPQRESETSPIFAETEETPDTTLDSPTTSRAIDMMDLDPNMMDEPYDSGYLQASAPIPISARTVAGHEAARLGSQLAASQRQRREREASGICEPRARSYDHQRQEKPEKTVEKLQYQSLDAVNREGAYPASRRFDADDYFYAQVESFVTPKNHTSNSLSSSSPDLSAGLDPSLQARDPVKNISMRLSLSGVHAKDRKNQKKLLEFSRERSLTVNHDFWDFNETQILEKNRISNEIEISSSRNVPIDRKIISKQFPNDESSARNSSFANESESRGTARRMIDHSFERKNSIPMCLGIPIELPHYVSSPELPAPMIEIIRESPSRCSGALNDCPSFANVAKIPGSGLPVRCEKNDDSSLTSCPSSLDAPGSLRTCETKRYGRSKSALTLSSADDPRGESESTKINDPMFGKAREIRSFVVSNCQSCRRNLCKTVKFPDHQRHDSGTFKSINFPAHTKFHRFSPAGASARRSDSSDCNLTRHKKFIASSANNVRTFFHKYSMSLPSSPRSYDRRFSLQVPFDESRRISALSSGTCDNYTRASLILRDPERSRSLSPCHRRCACYNCNVTALIRQSLELPPDERSNFQTYFARSLSHKFFNCRCCEMSIERARATRRLSRSASPGSMKSLESCRTADRTLARSLTCLDLCDSPEYGYNRRFSMDIQSNTIRLESNVLDRRTNVDSSKFSSVDSASRQRSRRIDERSSSLRGLVSLPKDSSRSREIRETVARDRLQPAGTRESSLDVDCTGPIDRGHSVIREMCRESLTASSIHEQMNKKNPQIDASDSMTDQLASNILADKTIPDRRFSRQSSCPGLMVTTDTSFPRILDRHLSNFCLCDCTLVEEPGTFMNSDNCLTYRRSSPSLSSKFFTMPDRGSFNDEAERSLSRKFSCPEIIAKTGINPKRIEQTFVAIDLPYYAGKYRQNFLAIGDDASGYSRHEKSMNKQISCPEIIAYCPDSSVAQCHSKSLSPSIHENSCRSSIPNHGQGCPGTCREYSISRSNRLCPEHDQNNYCDRSGIDIASLKFRRKVQSIEEIYKNSKIRDTDRKNTKHESSAPSSLSSSSSSRPRIQTQRSFSSPDTRPSIIQQPDPTCTARRHRHSISGQMSYFKLLGYNVSKKLTGSTNSLFSTAVISGSSSAPNLKDMVPQHASAVAAIEGFGGVPPIRPLETLHNALSLRQLDFFLDMMTNATLYRTPASSPPKYPSPGGSIHGGSVIPNLSICSINREYHSSDLEAVRYITPAPMHYKSGLDSEGNDNRNQLSPTSPNSAGWSSEPQSFLSSGPSSPAPTSAGECSMSMSLVSNDGTIDQKINAESRGSISYTDYYSNEDGLIRKSGPDLKNLRESVAAQDEMSQDSILDDDEEHTLTLRETEEHRKQDVKFIFDQSKDNSLIKPCGSSYKKIGRFRVESMEIPDEDVRIKEAADKGNENFIASSNLSLDRARAVTSLGRAKSGHVGTSLSNVTQDETRINYGTLKNRGKQRIRTIARSQSVSTPQYPSRRIDADYECQETGTSAAGSFSTMSCEDLENWKLTAAGPPASSVATTGEIAPEVPILTLASSLKGLANVVVGFNVQDGQNN